MLSKLKGRLGRPRVSPATVIATIALVVALGGVAKSAVPGPDGQIHACYLIDPDPDFSYVYVTNHDQACQPGEERLTWSQQLADQGQVADAEATAGKIGIAGITASLDKLLGTVEKALKKVPDAERLDKKKIVNPFKKKEAKGLKELMKGIKRNDREQARHNKLLAQGLRDVGETLRKAQVSQQTIEQALLKIIRAVKIGL